MMHPKKAIIFDWSGTLFSNQHATLFADARQNLPKLAMRYKLFISSSSIPSDLINTVGRLQITHLFCGIFGSIEDFCKGPKHIDRIQAQTGLSKKEILYIGDDSKDQTISDQANIDFIKIRRDLPYDIMEPSSICNLKQLLTLDLELVTLYQ